MRIGANSAAIAAVPRNGQSVRGDATAHGTKQTLSRGPIVSLSRPRFYLYFDLRDLPFRFGRPECEALIAGVTMGKAPPEVGDQIVSLTDGAFSSRN